MTKPTLLAAGALLLAAAPAAAQTPAAAPDAVAPAPDYATDAAWLCRPGRKDACAADQATTVVQADGRTAREAFRPDPAAKLDCFYVYPTVSTDPGALSDASADAAETRVAGIQFARFSAACRTFAPLYRQVTLNALRLAMTGRPTSIRPATPYEDVRAAWRQYLAKDNGGRGVVLYGHSQGAGVLNRLIAEEIDGKPVQRQVVSALLIGSEVLVPPGKDVGGSFQSMPLCRSADQTGCVVTYASFRESSPPPANTRFGRPRDPAKAAFRVGCVNPVDPAAGDRLLPLHSYLPASAEGTSSMAPPPAWATGVKVDTPFVSTPGLLSARCASDEKFTYLAVKVNGDPADPRLDDIAGDVMVAGQVQKDWGLHLIDVSAAQGDLVALVKRQSAAWLKGKR